MILSTTKSTRRFGYTMSKELIGDCSGIAVPFNGFSVGVKSADWKYHRISAGYRFTRALSKTFKIYNLTFRDNVLGVKSSDV